MFYTSVLRQGNKILHRYIDKHGGRFIEREEHSPTLFVKSEKETGWKTLKGVPVEPKQFPDIASARDFHSKFKDIRPDIIHGITDYDLLFIHDRYRDTIEFDFNLIRTFFVDIECSVPNDAGFPDPQLANFPINAITVYDTLKKRYYTFSTVTSSYKAKVDNCLYIPCESEKQMITVFMNWWEKNYPDILTGWNSEGFDVPYIVNRFSKLAGEEFTSRLSPWGKIKARETVNSFNQDVVVYDIVGIEHIDYVDMYKKFTLKNRENYRLGFIAEIELGETKVEYEGSLYDLAEDNPDMFLDYNVHDVTLLVRMEAKLQLLYLVTTLAYFMKVNYSDTLGVVRLWTSKIAYELYNRQMVIDTYHRPTTDTSFEAAFVKEPIRGKYGPIATLDATSMYPHMIMLCNISPDTKINFNECPDELKPLFKTRLIEPIESGEWAGDSALQEHNITIAGNGQMFRKDKVGILAELMNELFQMRKAKKNEMLALKREKESKSGTLSPAEEFALDSKIRALDVLQNSLKICLNSVFGATGNKHFPLFDLDLAEGITFTGQAGIRFVARRISEYISKVLELPETKDFVIYIDTDSLAVNLTDLMDKFGLDKSNVDLITKIADGKLSEVAKDATEEYCNMLNGMWPALIFKREKVCTAGIYCSKKKYILKVWDNEGVRYHEPEISVTGLETNRSSTPKYVREYLLKAYEIVIDKTEEDLQEFVSEFRQEFEKQEFDLIAFPRGVNDVEKYADRTSIYKKGCPMAVRAALMYNHLLEKHGLDKKYLPIYSGNKIKFIHLKDRNPTRENVIAYLEKLPPEFNLEQYVDYDVMFTKTFSDPLQNVIDAIGWTTEKQSDLSAFF